jgi:hypothetical protein
MSQGLDFTTTRHLAEITLAQAAVLAQLDYHMPQAGIL